MKDYDVGAVLGLLASARAIEMCFTVADEPGWFPFNFGVSIVYDLKTFEDLGRTYITHPAVLVPYQDKRVDIETGATFAQVALGQYRRDGANLF